MVELLSLLWIFTATTPALSSLDAQHIRTEFAVPDDTPRTFTVKCVADLKNFNGKRQLLEIPDVLEVFLRQHNPADRHRQNYPAFKMRDGRVPVLEAKLKLHSAEHPEWKEMVIGFPLAMLEKPEGRHEIVLHFSGVRWSVFVDGVLLDNDFPFGYPKWGPKKTWSINPAYVEKAEIHLPGIEPRTERTAEKKIGGGIQYWLPFGHNTWVGDVATLYHDGRYHVFYLYDRRHHASKFGKGAHYFEHLSTADFKTWIEHEPATPLEEQWECIGTGTPFVFDGEFCLAYGLHTTRVHPVEKTTLPEMNAYLKKNGKTGFFDRKNTKGIPGGSTYSVFSESTKRFEKTGVLFHPCENPSVFVSPGGKLRMAANFHAKGFWESGSVDEGWHCVNPVFPPGGDCTFYFRWDDYDYVIGGFRGLWSKPADAPETAYESLADRGLDFYDGANVPAVSPIPGGRFLMAGWVRVERWGGNLILRELVRFPGGRLGSKWPEEVVPQTEKPRMLAGELTEQKTFPAGDRSFMLSFRVVPGSPSDGKLGILFMPESGEKDACEFQVDVGELRAQFAPGVKEDFSEREKSLREGGSPHNCRDYAVENLIGLEEPYTVRIIVKGCDKTGGSLIDAEIAGARTMLTFRPGLTVGQILFKNKQLKIENLEIAVLAE